MNSESTTSKSMTTYRRHIFYVDRAIQRPLLIGLVLLEVTLLACATWLAYQHFNTVIDESLYRVHITYAGPIWKRLAKEGVWMLALFAVINLLVLMIAEWVWSRRESMVTQSFNQLMLKTSALDFSKDLPVQRTHRVLSLALSWREHERDRFLAVGQEAEQIRTLTSTGARTSDIQESLMTLKSHLS